MFLGAHSVVCSYDFFLGFAKFISGQPGMFRVMAVVACGNHFRGVGQDSSGQKSKISMLDDPRSENGNKLCLFWTLCTSTCTGAKECDEAGFSHVARFAAHRAVYASKSDRIFCVVPSTDGDTIRET